LLYADLLTYIPLKEKEASDRVLSLYIMLGYRAIGIVGIDRVSNIGGLSIIPRVVVSDIDLFRPSRKVLVAFKPRSKEHARRAGKAKGVSTILFDRDNIDICDDEQIEVMRRSSTSLEVVISPLLDNNSMPRFLNRMEKCIKRAIREGVDVIIASGAREVEEIWAPGSIRSLCGLISIDHWNIIYSWVEVIRRWNPGLKL